MTEHKFQRFGKYLILDHLVDGGMAKICRARFLGEQANKIVAIKMVQAQYSKDPSFVQMFEDELKVTFDLLHPNIAQVYDYGMVDEQLYSAMEYIDGANLKQFLDRLKQKKYVFPVEISTYIISQVSQALHYAHNFTDKLKGTSFNIIHRDISPHNIMLTYDGAVKVIDFGIAKADSNSEATQAGTIKGKLSYLAPEYLDGLDLDHRYDQFAVGITLWEMLCSRKLFSAKNDLAVLKLIQNCKVPRPSSINPNVPAELDEIVLKALSKDRNKRYENMDKLNRALVKFLYSNYPEFNATDLGYFAKQLFAAEIKSDSAKFVEFGKIDIKPFLNEIASSQNNEKSFISEDARTGKIELDLGEFKKNEDLTRGLDIDTSGLTSTGLRIVNKKNEGTRKSPVTRVKNQAGSRVTRVRKPVNNRNVKQSKESSSKQLTPAIVVASLFLAVFTQNDFITKTTGFDILCMTGLECPVEKAARVPAEKTSEFINKNGQLNFVNFDTDMKILLDGREVNLNGIKYTIPFNQKHSIVVKKPGHKKWTYPKDVVLTADNPYLSIRIPELEEIKMGYVSTSLNFTSGSVIIYEVDGEQVEKSLPLNGERVPAGTYEAVIANKLLQTERKIRFTVKENRKEIIR